MLKKFYWAWINFWGRRYRVYKNDEVIQTILIYGHRIYIIDR